MKCLVKINYNYRIEIERYTCQTHVVYILLFVKDVENKIKIKVYTLAFSNTIVCKILSKGISMIVV
jgi:hypothetical protein